MRSIRRNTLIIQGAIIVLALAFFIGLSMMFRRNFTALAHARERDEIRRIDEIIGFQIDKSRALFERFAANGAPMDVVEYMDDLSDIFYSNDNFIVTRVFKKSPSSPIAYGYRLQNSEILEQLRAAEDGKAVQSPIVRSSESKEFGVYLILKSAGSYLIGRIELSLIDKILARVAAQGNNIIVIVDRDGSVITGTGQARSLRVLPRDGSRELTLDGVSYFFTRERSRWLDNDIAVLSPAAQVFAALRTAECYYWSFIAALTLMLGSFIIWQYVRLLRPLADFSAMLARWNGTGLRENTAISRYKEISTLYEAFDISSTIIRESMDHIKKSEAAACRNRDLGIALSSISDIDQAFDAIIEAALEFEGVDCAAIYVVDPATGSIECARAMGFSNAFLEKTARYGPDSENARLVAAGIPSYLDYTESVIEELGFEIDPAKLSEGLQSIGVIPIIHEERAIACLNVGSHYGPIPNHSRISLETLASLVSNSIARIQAGGIVAAALREKETLLKEVHHRVKNNLQLILSLINLQANGKEEAAIHEFCNDLRNRIQSMAAVHEQLYRSENFADVEFGPTIEAIITSLLHTYPERTGRIEFKTRIEPISLSITQAIPCALIANELVTNALKYAFVNGMEGCVISLTLRTTNGEAVLEIFDNGVGLPNSAELNGKKTLGLTIVSLLTRQISGRLDIGRNGGTRFTITFTPR